MDVGADRTTWLIGIIIVVCLIASCAGTSPEPEPAPAPDVVPAVKSVANETPVRPVASALTAGADIIMFDNMTLDDMKEGLRIVDGRAMTEASGGIIEETIIPIAETGVDIISVGALTHSVTAIDVSMDMGEIKASARRVIAERRSAAD